MFNVFRSGPALLPSLNNGGRQDKRPLFLNKIFPSRSAGKFICQFMCYFLSVFICMHPMGCSNIGSSGQKNVFLPGDDGRIKQQFYAVFCLGQENKMKLRKRKSLFMSHRGSCLRLSHGDLLWTSDHLIKTNIRTHTRSLGKCWHFLANVIFLGNKVSFFAQYEPLRDLSCSSKGKMA